MAADQADRAFPFSCVPGIEWPGLATGAGASVLALHWQLERSQWWPPERLLEHQFRQLCALAAHALANGPYYQSHLERAGLRDASELTPQTFLRWPLLKKSDVRPNFAQLCAQRYPKEHGAAFETYTSGSTGEPTCVLHSELVRSLTQSIALRDHLWHQRDFAAKFAAIRIKAERGILPGWGGPPEAAFSTGPAAGRTRNMAKDPAGRRFWPTIRSGSWSKIAPLRKVQLVQRSIGQIEIRFVMDRELTVGEASQLREVARERLGYPFEIVLTRVAEIPRSPGGKFEDFVSELPPD